MIAALVAFALATAPVAVEPPVDKGKAASVDVVDLNQASAVELCTLPGIGPKKAEAILALRNKRAFTRVTQLLQVKGIGPKTLARLKARVRLGVVAPAGAQSTAGRTEEPPSSPSSPSSSSSSPSPSSPVSLPALQPLRPLARAGG